MHKYIYIHTYAYAHICTRIHIHTNTHAHRRHCTTRQRVATETHNLCTNMHTHTYTHVYTCIRTHLHMHIYTHVHVCTYTHIRHPDYTRSFVLVWNLPPDPSPLRPRATKIMLRDRIHFPAIFPPFLIRNVFVYDNDDNLCYFKTQSISLKLICSFFFDFFGRL